MLFVVTFVPSVSVATFLLFVASVSVAVSVATERERETSDSLPVLKCCLKVLV